VRGGDLHSSPDVQGHVVTSAGALEHEVSGLECVQRHVREGVELRPGEVGHRDPAWAHAIFVSPEQSKVFGPAVAKTYGFPNWARAYAITAATPDEVGTGPVKEPPTLAGSTAPRAAPRGGFGATATRAAAAAAASRRRRS
jgi:hypothetical protein